MPNRPLHRFFPSPKFSVPCLSSDFHIFFFELSRFSFLLYLLPLLEFQIFATKKDTKNPFQVFDVFLCFPDIVSQMIAPGFTPEQNFTT